MTTEQLLPPEPQPERRVAVLPLVIAAVVVVIAVVFAVVVVGLARSGTPEPVAGAASASPTVPVEVAPPAGPRREAAINECVDELDDAEVDLESAQVADDDGSLVARVSLVTTVPDGTITLGIFAVNDAGNVIYQLAATVDDGEVDEFFAQRFGVGQPDDNRGRGNGNGNDNGGTETDDLDRDDLEFDGTTMLATFPKSVLRDLGNQWSCYEFTAVDGDEVDAWPG